jgi:hypothetical protein
MLKQAQSTRSAWLPAAEAVTDIEFERYFELCVSMVRGRTVICWMPRQRRLRLERLKREARLLPGKIDRRRKKYRGKSVEELVRMGVL